MPEGREFVEIQTRELYRSMGALISSEIPVTGHGCAYQYFDSIEALCFIFGCSPLPRFLVRFSYGWLVFDLCQFDRFRSNSPTKHFVTADSVLVSYYRLTNCVSDDFVV